jgi:hypothetical protein
MDFDTWLQQKGITGRVPRQAAIKLQDQWMKDTKGGGFQPSTGMATNQVSGEVTPYFMSSPNSAQPMTQKQPVLKPVPGKDGKAYNYNPVTGTSAPALIEGTTNQFEMDPKSNAMADMLAAMSGAGASAPMEEESPGVLSRIFGGVASSPAPTPTPTPTPAPTPAMTNAPAPVAAPTPRVYSAAAYQAKTGQALSPGSYEDANGVPFDIVP